MSRLVSMVIAIGLVGCSASHGATRDAGRSDGATFDAGTSDAGTGTTDSGIDPGDAGPPCGFVETLERACTDDSDCAVGVHQTDCCGNTVAIGMRDAERDRFDALEPICRASYPGCGCPSGPTTTDSGESAFDPSTLQVACVIVGTGRRCRTYVTTRPPDGR